MSIKEYQEALEKFKDFIIISHNDTKRELNKSIITLQDLINSYEHLSQIAGDLEKEYKELNDAFNDCLSDNSYSVALDKACELLSKNVTKSVRYVDEYGEFDNDEPEKTKEEWKEFLLKDARAIEGKN